MEIQNLPFIGRVRLDRALIYVSKEVRNITKWESKEDLLGIATDNLLILIKPDTSKSFRENISDTIKKIEYVLNSI